MFYVYILECFRADGTSQLYVGQTNNWDRRWAEHSSHKGGWTARFVRHESRFVYPLKTRKEAVAAEHFLKTHQHHKLVCAGKEQDAAKWTAFVRKFPYHRPASTRQFDPFC